MALSGNRDSGRQAMHSSTSKQVESKLTARHIDFEFQANLRIDEIRDADGNQVRLSEHRAPKEMVERFAEQMKAGAIFPAIVVNEHRELVDGNTRRMAALKNGHETIAAYICSDLSALQARSLSVELNQSHGLSMTEDEIHAFVASAVQEGQLLDTKSYARMTGVKESTLSRWVAGKQFQMRAEREAIAAPRVAALSESVQAALHVAHLKSVFIDVTALAVAAKVPSAQLKKLITKANSAPSEAEALAVVAEEREARADDIKTIARGFKAAKRRSQRSAMHMAGLLKFDVEELLDVAPEKRHETFLRLRALQQHIDAAVEQARSGWQVSDAEPVTRQSSSADRPSLAYARVD
jgi:hypothetical protein